MISESIRTSQYSESDLPIGSKYVSDVEKCLTDDLTFVGGSEEEEEEVSIEMLGRVSDEVVVSSVERDRLTNSTDADVVVVRPVGPVIPLSLLDDAEIPDGSGMCRLDTGGVSPVDAREWIRIKGLLLPTLSAELVVCTPCSESVVSMGSGVVLETTVLCSRWDSPVTEDVFEVDDGVLLIVLLVRDAVLDDFDADPSRGRHKPPFPLLRASSTAFAAAWSWVKG